MAPADCLASRLRGALDRVSIRLQTGIAVTDLAKHVLLSLNMVGDDSPTCSVIGFVLVVLLQVYMLLNIAIALNLHLVVLLNRKPRRGWVLWYWGVSLGLPLVLNVPLLCNTPKRPFLTFQLPGCLETA